MTVSICCITYNHEKFIAKALDGFLMQQTNFDVEIVVGEDCSTDNTRSICKQYKEKYPDKVKLLLPEKNLGVMPNFIQALENCNGEYVALCDGDDYWTDPFKLQKQVEFLEANKEYSICYHRVLELHHDEQLLPEKLNSSETAETYTIKDLAYKNIIRTPSVVYRNNLISELPAWMPHSPVGDYVIHLLNARKGKIKYFPETMAVYRKHTTSTWSSAAQITILQKWFKLLDLLLVEFANDQEATSALQKQYVFTYSSFWKECSKGNELNLLGNTTKQLVQNQSFFSDYWFDNIFIEQLKLVRSYPKGLKKSTKFFVGEVKNFWTKNIVKR